MAKYKDPNTGQVIEVGNPDLNPELTKGKTLVSDAITSEQLTPTESLTLPPQQSTRDFSHVASASIEGLLGAINALTPEEQKGLDFQNQILDLTRSLGGESARKTELETQQGVTQQRTDLQAVIGQLQGLQKEALAIPLQIQQEFAGRGVTTAGVAPIQAGRLRENAIKSLELAAIGQTLQGNLQLAETTIQNALDAEFEPKRLELEIVKQQYLMNKDTLERIDKKRADNLNLLLNERTRILNENKEDKSIGSAMAASAITFFPNDPMAQREAQRVLALDINDPNYLQSVFQLVGKYQADPVALETAILEQKQKRLAITKTQAEINKINAEIEGARPPQFDLTSDAGNLAAFAQNLASKFSSKFAQSQFLANVQRIGAAGDNKQLADYIFSEAISQLPDAASRTRALGNYNLLQKLSQIEKTLAEYKAAGGETNIFRGTKEDILARLGTVSDLRLREIGIQLQDTLDQLARARTGAVITESEEKFYKKLLPGIIKSADLNQATINGLKDSLAADLNSSLKFQLTGAGFKGIEPYLDIGNSDKPIGQPTQIKYHGKLYNVDAEGNMTPV